MQRNQLENKISLGLGSSWLYYFKHIFTLVVGTIKVNKSIKIVGVLPV